MDEINASSKHELFRLICSHVIGEGSSRVVYAHALDPDLVVKFEESVDSFQNVTEWQTWEIVRGTKLEKWFAPCIGISPCGTVLIQKRTKRPTNFPKKIPPMLCDLKAENFGLLSNGKFVAHDYGHNRLLHDSIPKKLVKAKWINNK